MDGNVPFSTVYGLKQNFKLINLSNQSLNIIPNNEKTKRIGSDELIVCRNNLELPATNSEDAQTNCDTNNIQRMSSTESPTGLRKRNVNWNVPMRNRLLTKEMVGENYDRQSQVNSHNLNEMAKLDEVNEVRRNVVPVERRQSTTDRPEEVVGREPAIDDDGFESLNGKSSSGEDNAVTSALLTMNQTGESIRNISNVNDSRQSIDGSAATTSEHLIVS